VDTIVPFVQLAGGETTVIPYTYTVS
jgi:hypothetical protein